MNLINKNFANKNILVYGIGKSGLSAIKLLIQKGANVFVYDDAFNNEYDFNDIDKTLSEISVQNGCIGEINVIKDFQSLEVLNLDLAVLSPGVSLYTSENVRKLVKNKIKCISELELGFMFLKGEVIAVTGTNGKTTTVSLLEHILKDSFISVFLCGNIGRPVTEICQKTTRSSCTIIEVSSFMLETVNKFRTDISCILNISPDHISWHNGYENYIKAKTNLIKNCNNNEYILFNEEIKNTINSLVRTKENTKAINTINKNINNKRINYFNSNNIVKKHFLYIDNKKYLNLNKVHLLGKKIVENMLAVIKICKYLNISDRKIKNRIISFLPPPHRLQLIHKYKGISFFNDSKSTNIDSTICGLSAFSKNVILLVGGSDKGLDFDEVFCNCKGVKHILCFGEVRNKILMSAKKFGFINISTYKNLYEACYHLKSIIEKGDVVLLSPGTASFDEFKNYEQRGEKFVEYIKELF